MSPAWTSSLHYKLMYSTACLASPCGFNRPLQRNVSQTKHLFPIQRASPAVFPILANGNFIVPVPQAPKIIKPSQLIFSTCSALNISTSPVCFAFTIHPESHHFSPHLHLPLWSGPIPPLTQIGGPQPGEFCAPAPPGDFDRVWRRFWLSQLVERVLSSGQRPGALLNTMQCTGQPPTAKIYVAQNVNGTEVMKSQSTLMQIAS